MPLIPMNCFVLPALLASPSEESSFPKSWSIFPFPSSFITKDFTILATTKAITRIRTALITDHTPEPMADTIEEINCGIAFPSILYFLTSLPIPLLQQ